MPRLTPKTARCELCHEVKPLRASHIVPEFMWAPIYDEKHRMVRLEVASVSERWQQKGERERLLCADCEHHLNDQYERPFAELWKTQVLSLRRPTRLELDLPFELSTLFLFSVLWRASVASGAMWSKCSLCSRHDERWRVALLRGELPRFGRYDIGAVLLEYKSEVFHAVLPPLNTRSEGCRQHYFIFGGFAWLFTVSEHSAPHWRRQGLIPGKPFRVSPTSILEHELIRHAVEPFLVAERAHAG